MNMQEFKELISEYLNGDEITKFFVYQRILSSLDVLVMDNCEDKKEVDDLFLSICA